VAERPSIQQCRARRMFCIWSQRRAVGAEGWHAGAWVDESTTANLVESRPKPRMTDHLQHTLIGVSRQGLFSKECRHVLHGVSHGPNARCGSARGHRGWGRKLSRVLSFVRHANGLSVCMYVGMYVCMSVCLSGLVSQMPIESIFSAPAPLSWASTAMCRQARLAVAAQKINFRD
jgi:hypothetical protein